MSDPWKLNLASWIVQDGNYGDFAKGDECEVALEFWAKTLELTEQSQPRCTWVTDCYYDVVARVVLCQKDVWVLDFGLLAYRESSPLEGLAAGDWVTGRIGLGIDPFFYFERLHALPGMPPLIYSWTIERILLQTAPFVEATTPGIGNVLVRDESKRGYRNIDKTDAWHDDGGNAEYLLECCHRDIAPKKTSRTAT
ncbi:MAG TPA: hypothetical protein PLP01_01140 [Phycisphaerae bacterium]|nr:hypothetical protein [Phycisphaerae bacterium]